MREVPKGMNAHELLVDLSPSGVEKPNARGIAYHQGKELVLIANAGEDAISVYEKNDFKRVETKHHNQRNTGIFPDKTMACAPLGLLA